MDPKLKETDWSKTLKQATEDAEALAAAIRGLHEAVPAKGPDGDTHPVRMALNHALDLASRAHMALRDDVPAAVGGPAKAP